MEHTNQDNRTLMQRMHTVNGLMQRYLRLRRGKGGPHGDPHRGQARVLALLRLKPEISQRELGYLLDIRPQSLGELLGKLEKSGYITRMPSTEDRRVMQVTLTEAGHAAAQEADERRPETDLAFAMLTEAEKEQLGALLDKVIAALYEEVGTERGPQESTSYAHGHGWERCEHHGDPHHGDPHRGSPHCGNSHCGNPHHGGPHHDDPHGRGPRHGGPRGMRPGLGWQPEDGWPDRMAPKPNGEAKKPKDEAPKT